MQSGPRRCNFSRAARWPLWMLLALAGCSQPGKTSVSPEAAATQAIELYDANKDGAIDSDELKKCPPLAVSIQNYDADVDGRLSAEEIAKRFERLFASSSNLAEVSLTFAFEGRPLSGATVRLRPVDFVADVLQPAEGVTDEFGVARPTIGDEHLPADFRGSPLAQFGPYVVEVTHPEKQLPARYNTATELGFEVDPSSRSGLTAHFDLKSN